MTADEREGSGTPRGCWVGLEIAGREGLRYATNLGFCQSWAGHAAREKIFCHNFSYDIDDMF